MRVYGWALSGCSITVATFADCHSFAHFTPSSLPKVNLVVPGTRVRVVGVFSIFQRGGRGSRRGGNSSLPSPYIRVVGLQTDNAGVGRATTSFRPDEVETFK